MSYQHHWVVVYDEDWGAFMVDAETTNVMLEEGDGTIYNKTTGHWEFAEEGSEELSEYQRLEEILAYNLTRLDLTAGIGQDTHMSRKVQVSISFQMTSGDLEWHSDEDMTDEEIMQYAKECFFDDIYEYVSSDELMDIIHAEIIND